MKQIKFVVMGVVGVVVSLGFLKAARADEWNYVRGELTPAQVRRLVAPGRRASATFLEAFGATLSDEDHQAFVDARDEGAELPDELLERIDFLGQRAFKMVCQEGHESYFSDDEDPYCIDAEGNDFEPLELREVIWDGVELRICTLYYRETRPSYDVQDCLLL